MPITPLPTAPDPTDPATFDDRAGLWAAALQPWTDQANALEESVEEMADEAAASALTAVNAPGTAATSTTSLSIATGSKNPIIQTGKALVKGMSVKMARTSAPGNWMYGEVDSYNSGSGSLVVIVSKVRSPDGTGPYTDWTIHLTPPIDFTSASTAEILAGTSDDVAVTPSGLRAASHQVDVADAATITLDLSAGENFVMTGNMTGNRVIGTPTGMADAVNRWFQFKVRPGGYAPTFSAAWDFGDYVPKFSTDPAKADIVTGFVRSSGKIEARMGKGFGI